MKQLAKLKIIITRDSSQAGSLKDMLEDLGAEVISIPTISICDPPEWAPFDLAANDVGSFHWVVFTSINAVLQTHKRIGSLGFKPHTFPIPRIAAVGDKTAKQAEELGWAVDYIPEKFQAEGLAAGLKARGVSGQKIWFPRALVARHILIDELANTGAELVVTPVYQNTIPFENKQLLQTTLDDEEADWITFTSSSTVTNLFKILEQEPDCVPLPKIASIGSITTDTLHKFSLEPAFTADPQNLDGLCQGIVACESK
jgi:uroporphyrinogen III methyltransferase/synthase